MFRITPPRTESLLLLLSLILVWGPRAVAATPDQISEDFRLTAEVAGQWQTRAAEGWLKLARVGTSAKYHGTFTDNLNGGLTSICNASDANPAGLVITVPTRYGPITVMMDPAFATTDFTSSIKAIAYPKVFSGADVSAYSRAHAYFVKTYSATIGLSYGVPGARSRTDHATLHLIEDTLLYVVPRDPSTNTISSLVVITPTSAKLTKITSPGIFAETSLDRFDTNGLNVTVNLNGRFVSLLGRTSDGGNTYTGGAASAAARSSSASGAFTLTLQP
jgi:hypothetical protein